MPRNKYPEETRQKILDVSKKLFLEKGYDNTSIQDIIDGLGGLTKGVIYHHFKSKKDIFDNVMMSLSGETEDKSWHEGWEGTNGLDKLQSFIIDSLKSHEKQALGYSGRVILKSPRIVGEIYLQNFNEVVPAIKKYIDEGIKDGSIVTEFPEELAELFVLVLDIWFGMQIPNYSRKQFERKFIFAQKTFEGLNVPIINDEVLESAMALYDYLEKNKNC